MEILSITIFAHAQRYKIGNIEGKDGESYLHYKDVIMGAIVSQITIV